MHPCPPGPSIEAELPAQVSPGVTELSAVQGVAAGTPRPEGPQGAAHVQERC